MADHPLPLSGIKVLELAGLAPGPFAGLIFADAGADVLRVDRPSASPQARPTADMLARHKASIAVDLKAPAGIALIRQLALRSDILIDPFRPGVLERLGLGPDVLLGANPRLIYARLSGFRRDGRYKDMAGHDINYLAVSGALAQLGRSGEKPTPPWNILADFAGGGLMMALGVLLALASRATTGKGQVVEASMVDGVAYLAAFPRFALKSDLGSHPRGQNLLDTGCPYYDTYATADEGGYMAVGALEPQFFKIFAKGLGLDPAWETERGDRSNWPALREAITKAFKSQTRSHWESVFDGTDACCTPVLGFLEIEKGAAAGREGDQRPAVALRGTPLLAVAKEGATGATNVAAEDIGNRRGQGPGVPGSGYEGSPLAPGAGGEEALKRWQGWRAGVDYDVKDGAVALKNADKARL